MSGGGDGKVRVWTHRLEPGAVFDCSHLSSMRMVIMKVCLSADGVSMLVGTNTAELFEISAVDGSNLRVGALAAGQFSGVALSMAVCSKR